MSSTNNGNDRSSYSCDEVAQAVDSICGENLHDPDGKTQSTRECHLCGEGVTALWTPRPLGVPETTHRMESRSTVEDLIRQRSGCRELKNVLLLVTPGEFPKQKNCNTVHCYCLHNRSHQGVTTVTQNDVRLIECYHEPDNYSIVHCTGYIAPEDAAKNTPIKAEVFQIVQEASKAVRSTWYRGQVVRLAFRCSRSQLVGVSPPKQNIFGIRSLKQPKIAVRMPSYLAFLPSTEDIKKERKLRLRRDLQREFCYSSQQNLGKRNFIPNYYPFRRWHRGSRGPISKNTPESKVRGRPLLCEHLGFNFQKVSELQKKRALIKKKADQELAPNKNVKKSPVKQGSERVSPMTKTDTVKVLTPSRDLRYSSDHGALPPSKTLGFDSVIHQSSSTFIRSTDPLRLPRRFSKAALWHLERRLLNPSARDAFYKLGILVGQINERPCPQEEDLQKFFKLAELVDLKMYVRQESNFPGWPPVPGPRHRLECYVFDDRREYMASICMLRSQLRAMARLFPQARRNLRFIENAFDLTPIPSKLNKWLKKILVALNARPVYDLLGELTLDIARPPAAVFEINENMEEVGK